MYSVIAEPLQTSMPIVISQRHKFKFYLSLVLGCLIFLAIGGVLLMTYFRHPQGQNLQIMPFFSLAIFVLAIYTIYCYIKNAPKIQINPSTISFNYQAYNFFDLIHIELTGKQKFPYLFGFPMEATTLQFNDGTTKYIFDDMYQNAWQIKSFLKQVIIDKKEFVTSTEDQIDNNETDQDYYDTFKGNQFTSLRGIMLWGFIGYFTYVVLTSSKAHNNASLTVYFVACVVWFFLNSFTMDYFELSSQLLVIKNHNLWWRKKVYRLSNIEEIVFETRGKMPNCMRVITKDFRNKLYLAGTLSDKTWLALKDQFESYHIKVRNECIN